MMSVLSEAANNVCRPENGARQKIPSGQYLSRPNGFLNLFVDDKQTIGRAEKNKASRQEQYHATDTTTEAKRRCCFQHLLGIQSAP